MTAWGSALHTDSNNIETSASYGDRGDGSSTWFLPVRIYDKSAAGLMKAEDAAHVSGDSGVMMLAVRQDTLAALAGTTSDYIPLSTDALGRLVIQGAHLEDVAATSGDAGHFMLAIRRDAATSDAAAGDYHGLHVDALGKLRVTGSYPEDVAHTTADEGHFILGVASLARTARSADGDYTPLAVDLAGAGFSAIVPEGNSAWACLNGGAMAATSGVIKASAGKLYRFTVTNDNGAARWIQFFNLASVPADATVPAISIKLAAGESKQFDFGSMGRYFSTGICWSNSTTGPTKTIGTADTEMDVQYL